jgi:hypothetical protein
MDPQLIIVAVLVGAAVVYLGVQSWRALSGAKGKCGGGCGCSDKPAAKEQALIASESLRLKERGSTNRG